MACVCWSMCAFDVGICFVCRYVYHISCVSYIMCIKNRPQHLLFFKASYLFYRFLFNELLNYGDVNRSMPVVKRREWGAFSQKSTSIVISYSQGTTSSRCLASPIFKGSLRVCWNTGPFFHPNFSEPYDTLLINWWWFYAALITKLAVPGTKFTYGMRTLIQTFLQTRSILFSVLKSKQTHV